MKQYCPALMPYQEGLEKPLRPIFVGSSQVGFVQISSRRKTPCVILSTASEAEILGELKSTLERSSCLVIEKISPIGYSDVFTDDDREIIKKSGMDDDDDLSYPTLAPIQDAVQVFGGRL